MSFLSTGVNTGSWDRDTAYHLVRQMLDAGWHAGKAECPYGQSDCESTRGGVCVCGLPKVDPSSKPAEMCFCGAVQIPHGGVRVQLADGSSHTPDRCNI